MTEPVKSTSRQRSAISSPRRSPVNAAVRKMAPSCAEAAARTSASTSSGENTSRSPLTRSGWRSTAATGLTGNPHTFIARPKTPCISTMTLFFVRLETASVARHASISPAVMSSSRRAPNAGTSRPATIER